MSPRTQAPPVAGTCRVCGCTEDRACEGGWAWVDRAQTLCANCARNDPAYQLKRRELRPCGICGKGVMHAGSLILYRVRIETFIMNAQGIQQTHGLEQFFGGGQAGAVLAQVMGADPPLALRVYDPTEALLCQSCSTGSATVARLLERDTDDRDRAAAGEE